MKLSDYIKGLRKGKDAHRIELEAMKDPFLHDAIEGYDTTEGKHMENIHQLQKQVLTATNRHHKHHRAAWWSIAASLLIGVGISAYFIFQQEQLSEDTLVVMAEEVIQKEATRPTAEPEVRVEEEKEMVAQDMKSARTYANTKAEEEEEKKIAKPAVQTPAAKEKIVLDLVCEEVLQEEPDAAEYYNIAETSTTITDSATLEEVVVTGYGTTRKQTMVGSVSRLSNAPQIPFKQYLKENLRQQTDSLGNRIKGKVRLSFIVDRNGRPQTIHIEKSLHPKADAEAVRLLNEGPNWKEEEGRVECTIRFR